MLKRLGEVFEALCAKWGCEVVEFNGESDHIHLPHHLLPTNAEITKFINNLKTVSSLYVRKEFPEQVKRFYAEFTCLLALGLIQKLVVVV